MTAKLKQKSRNKGSVPYRLLPVLIVGMTCSLILMAISLLIYSLFCYFSMQNAANLPLVNALIYSGVLALTSLLITALINGHDYLPAVLYLTLMFGLSLLLQGSPYLLLPIVKRLLLTLLAGAVGITLGMVLTLKQRKKRLARMRSIAARRAE